VEWLSGLDDWKTLGTPIAFQVRNMSQNPAEYDSLSGFYRPSHADYTYDQKFGARDKRGGGRASGRETVARVIAGAIAKMLLRNDQIRIEGYICQVGSVEMPVFPVEGQGQAAPSLNMRLSDPGRETEIIDLIRQAQQKGDTLGGAVSCIVHGVPPGLGEPVFDKLQADLAKAMMSIGTAKAFEYGLGFASSIQPGSVYNDIMKSAGGTIGFLTNHDGGIQGGISNGQDIYFRVGFKPVPSVRQPQQMVNAAGEEKEIKLSGRHDACHIPRLVVVVEAMAAMVIADHLLRNRSSKL
jgi:chorismate synthase